jgi:hypothetical protein
VAPRRGGDGFRIDIDLDHARREGERVSGLLGALRRRHDLSRFEYTSIVRVVPGGDTFAHPVLTLGNRFAGSEDLLLSTYLHEQMHWYLWRLGGETNDPVAPFFDELVRRYPQAPIAPPDGALSYESTYLHLVVNWLEIAATAEYIGHPRARAVADASRSYRWIYQTVLRDWDLLGELYERHDLVPIRPAQALQPAPASAGSRRRRAGAHSTASPPSRRRPRGRGGRSAG